VTIRKPLAVWQNILLSIPIGAVGGALAGFVIIVSLSLSTLIQNLSDTLFFADGVAEMGSIIGAAAFPLAHATVGRTRSVFSIVPAGLVATVLGAWVGFVLLVALRNWPPASNMIRDSVVLLFLLIPVVAMFGACAWAAARERRRIAGRP
jgi:hypothetical protein